MSFQLQKTLLFILIECIPLLFMPIWISVNNIQNKKNSHKSMQKVFHKSVFNFRREHFIVMHKRMYLGTYESSVIIDASNAIYFYASV